MKRSQIEQGQVVKGGLPEGPVDFLFRQFDEPLQVADVTLAQQRVVEHGAQGWRQGESQARVQAVLLPASEQLEQRHVGFGDGLEEPVFLEELFVFRMPDKQRKKIALSGARRGRTNATRT